MGHKLSTLLLVSISCFAQWPAPKSATDAYQFVQARRAEAEKLWEKGDTRGFSILNDALAYLDQPLVKDLAAGNRYLAARRSNIYFDFAQAYAMQGKTREAIEYLNRFTDLYQSPSMVQVLEQDRHFDSRSGRIGSNPVHPFRGTPATGISALASCGRLPTNLSVFSRCFQLVLQIGDPLIHGYG
jgi:tetratricopeptide (TPR) repeat protein